MTGVLLTAGFYAAAYAVMIWLKYPQIEMFFHGGPQRRSFIPYTTIFLSCWALAILIIKIRKLALQRRALDLQIMPSSPDFALTSATADKIMNRLQESVDDARRFMLLNRVERSISNLKNLGRISDVAEGLAAQAEIDEAYTESTYTVLRGLIWAIPITGFIGTVLGLSQAIGSFGAVVTQGADIEQMTHSLSDVTGGLAIAFETTLIALVAALSVHLLMTLTHKKEEDFLDECADYCHRNVVAKLRTIQVNEEMLASVD